MNKMNKINKNTTFAIISALVIILFAVLAYLFPYSGDDWTWGCDFGLSRLYNGFDNYNGRYAGNLIVLVLTRVPALKIACMAISYYLTCLFAYKYSNSKRISTFLFSIALFFTMPKVIFVQAVVWTSGYTNYVPPILIMIFYVLLVKNIFKREKPTYQKAMFVLTFVLGFVGALFMENLTLYSIAFAFLIIVYSAIKYKRAFLPHISYLIGAILGSVVMFSNSSYKRIATTSHGPRTFAFNEGNTFKTIIEHINTIYTYLFNDNIILLGILTVLAIILCIVKLNKVKASKIKLLILFCSFINMATLILIIFKNAFSSWNILLPTSSKIDFINILFFAAIAILYYLSLSLIMIICLEGEGIKEKVAFLTLSIIIIVVPLLVVTPIGPRCFFPPFMLMIMMAVLMLENILDSITYKVEANRLLSFLFTAVIAALGFYYMSIYIPIHIYDVKISEYAIEQAQKSDEVTICNLPYDSYTWRGTPDIEPWTTIYKKFYGIDEKVNFKFVKYSEFNPTKKSPVS